MATPAITQLTSADEVIAMLKLTDAPPDPDEVNRAIDAATQAITAYTGRQFGSAPAILNFYPQEARSIEGGYGFLTGDFSAYDSVTFELDEGPIVVPFTPLPAQPAPGFPYTGVAIASSPQGIVVVEGTRGWPTIPEDVHYAATTQAAAWYTLDSSRVSTEWAADLGGGIRQPQPFTRGLLYSVRDLVSPYRLVSMF